MQTPNFRVTVVQEADTVEICGALKVGELLAEVCSSLLAEPELCGELWGRGCHLDELLGILHPGSPRRLGKRPGFGGSCVCPVRLLGGIDGC